MDIVKPQWMSQKEFRAYKKASCQKSQKKLARIALKSPIRLARSTAVERLTDQSILQAVAKQDYDHRVRKAAVERITNQAALAEAARLDDNESVAKAAIKRLDDQTLLAQAATLSPYESVRAAATGRVDDREALMMIVKEEKSAMVRASALVRLNEIADVNMTDLIDAYAGEEFITHMLDCLHEKTYQELLKILYKEKGEYSGRIEKVKGQNRHRDAEVCHQIDYDFHFDLQA